jgi:hypothetical protein
MAAISDHTASPGTRDGAELVLRTPTPFWSTYRNL